ncbi:MAG: type II secretion system GspH family protein [Planctomycetes bacterium]|nr:type II secretion system GspH family protein [Planctomycetota bacterium]
MTSRRPHGFTLVEILIVVVIMAVLAATIIPQFTDSAKDAKSNTALFNLHTLRAQIELYKTNHDGVVPTTLDLLTQKTNRAGTTNAADGALVHGPYIHSIPDNPLVEAAVADVVKAPGANPPTAAEADAGWLYDASTGEVWINHDDYLDQ